MKMQKAQQGFTLIELMIVIAIVGILAAIALPAYQDYTVRAKMAEPMAALAEAKTTIAEYYASNNSLPSSAASAINTNPNTDIVASIIFTSTGGPLLEAVVKQSVIPGAAGTQSFVLSGTTVAGGTIRWKCKPGAGTAAADGAVATKYLSANCRG